MVKGLGSGCVSRPLSVSMDNILPSSWSAVGLISSRNANKRPRIPLSRHGTPLKAYLSLDAPSIPEMWPNPK